MNGKSGSLGYAEFVKLMNIQEDNDLEFFIVKPEGVFVDTSLFEGEFLAVEERAALADHPTGNLKEPALAFPFSLKEFHDFIAWSGMAAAVNDEVLENEGQVAGLAATEPQKNDKEGRLRYAHELQRQKKKRIDIAWALFPEDVPDDINSFKQLEEYHCDVAQRVKRLLAEAKKKFPEKKEPSF